MFNSRSCDSNIVPNSGIYYLIESSLQLLTVDAIIIISTNGETEAQREVKKHTSTVTQLVVNVELKMIAPSILNYL